MQVLEKVAKAISRNYGVQVYFKGRDAYTDGKMIVLPTLPDHLDATDEAKVRGYCDHEIGHVVYTDMPVYKDYARTGRKQSNVLNLIEDLWIEKKQGVDYPGAKVNMERTANLLHAQTVAEKGWAEATEHILNKVWIEGRRQNCGFKFPDPDMTADVKKVLGDDFFERLSKVESTAQAVELAKRVIGKVTEYDDAKANPYEGDGEQSQQGQQDQSADSDKDEDCDCDCEGEGDNGAGGDEESEESDGDSDGQGDGEGYDGDDEELRDGPDAKGDTDPSDVDGDDDSEGEGGETDGEPESGEADVEGEVPSEQAIEGDDTVQTGPEEANTIKTDLEDFEDDLDALKDEIEQKHDEALSSGEYMPFSTENDMVITIEDYIKKKKSWAWSVWSLLLD